MDERDAQDPLRDLGDRLDKARRGRGRTGSRPTGESETAESRSALAVGFRIGLELVVAVALGVGIGWAFDSWLGTRPLGMIVFFFLGVGAGMTNVYRAVTRTGRAVGYRQDVGPAGKPQAGSKDPDWSDDED
jgi:ATP synthase protein I